MTFFRAQRVDTLPPANEDRERSLVAIEGGSGDPTALMFCAKDESDTYEWIDLLARYRQPVNVKDYPFGAVGGYTGGDVVTIADAGRDIDEIRATSGQAWLETTDSMDLAAFYMAQAVADATGRGVYFPKDSYAFTAPGFVHADVRVDLGGSYVTNVATDASRFTRGNRTFIFGILAREDFARFDTQNWEQTCDDIAQWAISSTNVTGTMPSIGDVILLRTTAASGTLPDYVTMNEVKDVAGTTITWKYPVELAMVAPILVNYSTITTIKSDLVGSAEPHRYFCSRGSSLVNGIVGAVDGAAFEVNCALGFTIDVMVDCPKGQAVYGNCFNRGSVRVRGICGGPKGAIELAVGSALTSVDVDLRYSGVDSDSAGSVSGNYAHIQLGEHTESCVVRGVLRMGNKPANHGITNPTGNRNVIDVEIIGHGITANGVVFASNAGIDNTYSGLIDVGSAASADYFALWSAGTGSGNVLMNMRFMGTVGTNAMRFAGPSLGKAVNVDCPSGTLTLDSGASGNVVISSYVAGGITSGGDRGSRVEIKTSLGNWPEDDSVIVAYNTSGTHLVSEMYGRTITNTGATAVRTRTAPVAEPGMRQTVVRDNASFAFRWKPGGTDIVGSGGAGKYLELQTDKGFVFLKCFVAGVWSIVASSGTIGYEP